MKSADRSLKVALPSQTVTDSAAVKIYPRFLKSVSSLLAKRKHKILRESSSGATEAATRVSATSLHF